MGIHEGAQEVLACPDHYCAGVAWRTLDPGTGIRGRTIYLHAVLICCQLRCGNLSGLTLSQGGSRYIHAKPAATHPKPVTGSSCQIPDHLFASLSRPGDRSGGACLLLDNRGYRELSPDSDRSNSEYLPSQRCMFFRASCT